MVREIIKNHDNIFSNKPKSTASDILFYEGKDVAFSTYGEYWRQVRKICVIELLSLRRVQQFQFVRDEEAGLLVDRIRRASLTSSAYCPVNLSEMLTTTFSNIICRCILGQTYEEKGGRSSFAGLTGSVMVHLMAFSVTDFFPSLRWVDLLRGFIGRVKKTLRELDDLFDQVVQEHKEVLERSDGESDSKDFADILLKLITKFLGHFFFFF